MIVPVAGIGASAGGLEACKLLLAHLPANPGMAFVFVQHLDPKHDSNPTEILARSGAIAVRQAADGMPIERDYLYVTPPDAELEIANQVLRLTPREAAAAGAHMPIDRFLRSLAHECGSRAIGVILSGTGGDGAYGLEAVKASGGVTLAQDPATARFGGMPQTAIRRGCVDLVLAPEAIAGGAGQTRPSPLHRGRPGCRTAGRLSGRAIRSDPHSAAGCDRHRFRSLSRVLRPAPHPAAAGAARTWTARRNTGLSWSTTLAS